MLQICKIKGIIILFVNDLLSNSSELFPFDKNLKMTSLCWEINILTKKGDIQISWQLKWPFHLLD